MQRFRRAYQQAFGEEIAMEEAQEMAARVLTLYELLARPLPDDKR